MQRYMMLFNYTQQGSTTLKQSAERIRKIVSELEDSQVLNIIDVGFLASAPFDTVFTVDALNENLVIELALRIAQAGNVTCKVHRLYSLDEFALMV